MPNKYLNVAGTDLVNAFPPLVTQAFEDVETDVNLKADKTNVLEKDNATAFTPTADNHPATKKYVDDNTEDEIIISSTAPVDTTKLWYDTTVT
jgi:hypothetical protein